MSGKKDISAAPGAKVTPLRPPRPCPECGKPSSREDYPFCSPRCRNIDLNRWLTGAYVIPAVESAEDSDDSDDASDKAER
ncbi:DNA gyrase inhibitor YacG [Phyllobacterium salinisoli]|uniref:DNA gyrase inhibitor YacG n=1 Tax=Phyllobacterium salinisoli TaxID=1899321 RepID=A0A368K8M4_9HYPH|nr:DNA gyrase inhibitor YacG [Phyllobacterium salinisoli]RCS25707.1 DNA gyrase inhibitor YacG [Phyllobacterium salinisoli]